MTTEWECDVLHTITVVWIVELLDWTTLFNPVYTIQPVVKPVVQTGLTTGLTTVLKEQLFVQPVVKPCLTNRFDKHGLTTLLNKQLFIQHGCQTGLYNRFDNRLYRVNGALGLPTVMLLQHYRQSFCDDTRRYDVPAPFHAACNFFSSSTSGMQSQYYSIRHTYWNLFVSK